MRVPIGLRRDAGIFGISVALACALGAQFAVLGRALAAERGTSALEHLGQTASAAFVRSLPIGVVDQIYGSPARSHLTLMALGLVQALLLYVLFRVARGHRAGPLGIAGVVASTFAMAWLALHASTFTTQDPYAYVGYGRLAAISDAFAPPAQVFGREFRPINVMWGSPLVPSYYGPLFVALAHAALTGASTLGEALMRMRWLGLGGVVLLIAGVAALRVGFTPIALTALNPAMWYLYVANAHNDVIGIALLVFAVAFVPLWTPLAAGAIVAAALMKLPLGAVGLVAFGRLRRPTHRIVAAAVTIAAIIVCSFAAGGMGYVRALTHGAGANEAAGGLRGVLSVAPHAVLALAALAAIAAVVLIRRIWRFPEFSMLALGSNLYAWYVGWGIAYAALSESAIVRFLIVVPFAAAVLDTAFAGYRIGSLWLVAVIVAIGLAVVRARREPPVVLPAAA